MFPLLLMHWRYCSLPLSHQYIIAYSKTMTKVEQIQHSELMIIDTHTRPSRANNGVLIVSNSGKIDHMVMRLDCIWNNITFCWLANSMPWLNLTMTHHDVITVKCYRHYWPFVRGFNQLLVVFITKNQPMIYWTHRGLVAHICVSNLTIIGSDNGLSPGLHEAII